MNSLDEISKAVQSLLEKDQYNDIVSFLTDDVLLLHKSADLFAIKAQAFNRLNDDSLATKYAEQALSIDATCPRANYLLSNQDSYRNVINFFETLLQLNPQSAYACSCLGNIYLEIKEVDKALEYFSRALEINQKTVIIYLGLGSVYSLLGDNEIAIECFSTGLKLDPNYIDLYYNRAMAFSNLGNYNNALTDFEKYLSLATDTTDYLYLQAKSKVEELRKLLDSTDYSGISELVNKIKDILFFNDGCITHYTSLSVAQMLVLDGSVFRLSEGAFLNDTSEGRELFNFLPFQHNVRDKGDETKAKPFAQKPFIGSFVAETKHDDLTLWRMYGKEDKEEAKGCALTIDMKKLLESIKKKLVPDGKETTSIKTEEEFSFYKVAYRRPDGKNLFVIPGASKKEETSLNRLMKELLKAVEVFNSIEKTGYSALQNVRELLNQIAYLFKSIEYQHENEIRLVVKGVGFEKIIAENFQPPKVYIELTSIRPIITKITLGPKVDRADEWAAAFYYSLDKEDLHPEIYISHLPFK